MTARLVLVLRKANRFLAIVIFSVAYRYDSGISVSFFNIKDLNERCETVFPKNTIFLINVHMGVHVQGFFSHQEKPL